MPLSFSALRDDTASTLARAGIDGARAEADILIAGVLDRTRGDVQLAALTGRTADGDEVERVRGAAARRARREPLQHIVGTAPFFGLDLAVGPGVFVPRPETEGLVTCVIDALRASGHHDDDALRIADLGSGSGAIALALASVLPRAEVIAVEASPHAWPWLVRNVRTHGHARVRAVFDRIGVRAIPDAVRPLSALVSNPPYVPRANEPATPEVRGFDPDVALYGGTDGLDVIRTILELGRDVVEHGGPVVLEHDDHQGGAVRALFAAAGYRDARTQRDLAGKDRVTWALA